MECNNPGRLVSNWLKSVSIETIPLQKEKEDRISMLLVSDKRRSVSIETILLKKETESWTAPCFFTDK